MPAKPTYDAMRTIPAWLGASEEEGIIVLKGSKIHEHCPTGIGGICDVDRAALSVDAAVETEDEPGIDRSESKTTFSVCLLDRLDVAEEPEQFDARGVRRKGQAADILELVCAGAGLQLTHIGRPACGFV